MRLRFGEPKLKRKASPTLIGIQPTYLYNQVLIITVPHVPAPLKKKDPMIKLEEPHIIDLESDDENFDPALRALDEERETAVDMEQFAIQDGHTTRMDLE